MTLLKKFFPKRKSNTLPKKRLRILVTAGPTREFLDPVRFLSNPSSGKMGYALAAEAARRGASVTLISGPVSLPAPPVKLVRVLSADQMYRATLQEAVRADVILMCAAVSDYRPSVASRRKLKKSDNPLVVRLVRTKDILKELGRRKRQGQVLVGFAAETERLEAYARRKLFQKNLDLIVANRIGPPGRETGFESDLNEAVLYWRSGGRILSKKIPRTTKRKMAKTILRHAMKISAPVGRSPGL